ncbi:MAG: sugar ABC transporter ATP-binding protein [Streptosporangiaceae bacterium]
MPRVPVVRAAGVTKRFGNVTALEGVDLEVRPGETLAVVGHNGAGKSTLVHLLSGVLPPDSGEITVGDDDVTRSYSSKRATALGIRIVYQELSLCPNLTTTENVKVLHRSLRGPGWRSRARAIARRQLEEIFPGHTIPLDVPVDGLPIDQRHMVEIARAASVTRDRSVRLLILDEPTASLDAAAADQLFAWMRESNANGLAVVFISHRLGEILGNADRVVVLRDGRAVGGGSAGELSSDDLVALMGNVTTDVADHATPQGARRTAGRGRVIAEVKDLSSDRLSHVSMRVSEGEIVGLAGLAGNGQNELLLSLFHAARSRIPTRGVRVHGRVAFVSGDRLREGVFPMFGVDRNITVGAMGRIGVAGWLSPAREGSEARRWIDHLRIRTTSAASPITSLSGGSQQKTLVARALAAEADLLLFNDPMRGVDVGTKRELYTAISDAAREDHAVLWYTTENSELANCDRVYVFRAGHIVRELVGDEISDEAIIRASFEEVERS